MNKVLKYLLPSAISSILLFSCGVKNEKELDEIKDLRVKLTKVDSMLKSVDADLAENKAAELKNNSQFIQYNINKLGDTLDFQTALFLNYYRALLRSYETVAQSHEQIGSKADSTRHGLDDLEHDITENSLADGLTPESCLEREEEQVNYLFDHAKTLHEMLNNATAGYDTLNPKVAQYMNNLKVKLSALDLK